MDNLFSHNPVSVETSSLFTDEKIASARTKIIEWLNDSVNATTNARCEIISKIQETIIHSDSEILDEFIDNVLAFSHDHVQDVRRAVVAFIEEVCKSHIQFLPRTVNVLAGLLRDTSPQVIKRVIQSCAGVYKSTLIWLCTLVDISDETETAWNTLCNMKGEILDMIDHDNDGIRTNAIKFLEGIVILQTYPDEDSVKRDTNFSLEDIPLTLKIIRRRKLEDEAIKIFDSLLKFHAASHISSVNLIACTGTICTIAKLRPNAFMHSAVDALRNLHANLPPTLTDSQVSSVRKHLKMQLSNIIKLPSAYEIQSNITHILIDLGMTSQEINKIIPKFDKQELQRRAKRALENNASTAHLAKRIKLEKSSNKPTEKIQQKQRQMEIDIDEVEEQIRKSNAINEQFIIEHFKSFDTVIELVCVSMINLPSTMPESFKKNYSPIVNLSKTQQIQKIAQCMAEQMTERRVGPGSQAITKEPPMRLKVSLEEEKSIVLGMRKEPLVSQQQSLDVLDDDLIELDDKLMDDDNSNSTNLFNSDLRREEATKKLRENMERIKGEQAMIPKMKQRAKTLKLQEVTKPISRITKERFLVDAVKRILKAERQSVVGGASGKRKRILTVMAATFTFSVREAIIQFIMSDIKNRLDLAISWLYEEYSLLQGFTRHSYIKTEQKPDYAYNKLLDELITGVISKPDIYKHKTFIITRIYNEAPLISDEAFDHLLMMCELTDLSDCAMDLIKELTIRRPPKRTKFLSVLLKYAVHENVTVRNKAIENINILYAIHKLLTQAIEEHALLWMQYLDKSTPPPAIFNVDYGRQEIIDTWNEDLAKTCLSLFLAILPYNEPFINDLCTIYIHATSDMKRTILRAIEIPIKKMGSENPELLKLIEQCPKGAETLITRIIYILTEKNTPHPELVSRVRELYQTKVSDVRLLIPVINGLTKHEILVAMPKLLKLNPIVVKEVFNRLLGIGGGKDTEQQQQSKTVPLTATELLVSLHNIDTTKVDLKFIVKATSICLGEKDTYTQEILAIVLQQLVEIQPLPTLIMRTIIQALSMYPRLAGFITNLLQRLIAKQVWRQKIVWDGYLKCCQRLKPATIPILMTLPPQQLQDALNICPDFRQPMIDYANRILETTGTPISKTIMDLLLGHSLDLFITELSGVPESGIIPLEDIKKECDVSYQPLPPGEDN